MESKRNLDKLLEYREHCRLNGIHLSFWFDPYGRVTFRTDGECITVSSREAFKVLGYDDCVTSVS